MMQPHTRAWLESIPNDYTHPWQQTLLEESGEALYDALLEKHLHPQATVLEAGCAGGRDALCYANKVRHWLGFDVMPHFLATARGRQIENASFVEWSSRTSPTEEILKNSPFDFVISRRGPTSVVQHLPRLAKASTRFIAIAAGDAGLLEQYRLKLEAVQWQIVWSAVVEAQGFLPTFEDYCLQHVYNNLDFSHRIWEVGATKEGFPFIESRVVMVAQFNSV